MFKQAGHPIPKVVRVSVGFPARRALSGRVGECWAQPSDGIAQVSISPLIVVCVRVIDILVHELLYASGIRGLGPDFVKAATAMWLTGKRTATSAGPALRRKLKRLCRVLGPFPHVALDPSIKAKKQSTRLIKLACDTCGYTVRTTRKWIAVGLPTCPCGERLDTCQ